ncbi:P-type ATPase [Tieghemostelium lacteum]|uniref:P-type Cu(+) transporter n=1 Tax=Tieghemostelium lacteum TaxID=361077 RepID=A0A152A7K8_TIELA|nr:P-type ATPase [Tieghemostelium lacteum]|eukprot:KYR02186.1 P-type ATPase [Tieghemostelium lacteum]
MEEDIPLTFNTSKNNKITRNISKNNVKPKEKKKYRIVNKKSTSDSEALISKNSCSNSCCDEDNDDDSTITDDSKSDIETLLDKTNCKKGCCGDDKPSITETKTFSIVNEEISESSCKKGCCGDKFSTSEPLNVEKEETTCKKGCCGDKLLVPEPTKTIVLNDSSCKKGCCGDKPSTSEPLKVEKEDEATCKKGCCGDKSSVTKPIKVEKEEATCKKGCCGDKPSVPETTKTIDLNDSSCKKGCCGEKTLPSIQVPIEKEDKCKSGNSGCCNDATIITTKKEKKFSTTTTTKEYCCEICIEDCCKSGCCKDECCLTYSISLPSISRKKKNSKVYASLIYKTCGLVGIKLGSSHQELVDDDEEVKEDSMMVSLEMLDQNTLTKLYLQVEGMTCADCVTTLDDKILSLYGIKSITTSLFSKKSEIEYYQEVIDSTEILHVISQLGFKPTIQSEPNTNVLSIQFTKSGLDCSVIMKLPGVLKVLNISDTVVNVHYDIDKCGPRDIYNQCKLLDHGISLNDDSNGSNSKSTTDNPHRDLLILSVMLCIPIIIIAFILPSFGAIEGFLNSGLFGKSSVLTVRVILLWVLSSPIQFIVGRPLYIQAYKTLVHARKCSMDMLVMISSSVAYFYSILSLIIFRSSGPEIQVFFETSAILLTLIMLGRYLETLAKGHTTDVLNDLLKLQSKTATLIQNGNQGDEEELDIRLIQKGDRLLVKAFSKVPMDGVVQVGAVQITVDESMVTGESKPVEKHPGDKVIGGSMNVSKRPFQIVIEKHPNQSVISGICRLVEEAQSKKAPFQSVADRIASVFVPCILALGVIVFLIWFIVANNMEIHIPTGRTAFTFALSFAMSVLVISCPCAVSLSTPTAIMVGCAIAAKNGILFKGGDIIENCQNLTSIVLDKTGTLTSGKMEISDFRIHSSSYSPKEFFQLIGSAESQSEHVIGQSLYTYAKEVLSCDIVTPEDYQGFPGLGLMATVNGHHVLIGNNQLISDHEVQVPAEIQKELKEQESHGKTVVLVSIDREVIGIVSFVDTIRPEAKRFIRNLKSQGVEVWMLSGDNEDACKTVANKLSITKYKSKCSPEDKYNHIKRLQQTPSNGKKRIVGMVGDGINDSIALIQSDISISVKSGTDLAIQSSRLILMNNNLMDIIVALDLSKKIFLVIKCNLLWAFIYNCIGIPLACGLFYPFFEVAIPPSLSGLSELLSSLPVICFSLLLNKYSKPSFSNL